MNHKSDLIKIEDDMESSNKGKIRKSNAFKTIQNDHE